MVEKWIMNVKVDKYIVVKIIIFIMEIVRKLMNKCLLYLLMGIVNYLFFWIVKICWEDKLVFTIKCKIFKMIIKYLKFIVIFEMRLNVLKMRSIF